MEPENLNQEAVQVKQTSPLHKVTPLSKYLAAALFIILPFVGGWIGYMYAPEKVVEIEKEVIREVEVENEVSVEETNETVFPVIAFERAGLLSDEEREILNKKFVEPYVDYYQVSNDSNILTTVIEVPQELGEPYVIRSVTADGNAGGFLFGLRGGNFNYWTPGCFGGCEFTDEYTQKHPEVIEQYKANIQP